MNGPDEGAARGASTARAHGPDGADLARPLRDEPDGRANGPQTAAAGADGELLLDCRRVSIRHEGAARPSPAGVDLTVRRGEAVLLLGPSGCGKSTLALAVAGLVPGAVPARVEGEVRVRRSDAAGGARLERLGEDAAPGAADVAVVFQDADAQLVAASVFDEVAFGLENLLRPVEEIERRVEWALRRVRLWERRDEAPELLSGGERQRLAIAAAVALGAPLLVLDEPTANLDPAARAEVYELLAEIMRDGEHGMLLVEHNLDEAVRVATRLVVLDGEGAVIADGPPRELFAERGAEFERLGVWMPLATLAAERLRTAGWPLRGRPLSGAELARAIDEAVARLPPSGGPEAPPPGPARQEAERPAALRCEGLGVRRRGRTILHDVSLRLPRGSFTALVGRGGAGKSTLLLALAGLEAPEEGRVLAGERPLTGLPAHELRSRVGFVFQNPEHQFVRRTAREELELELRLRGGPGERRELAEAQLGRFGLAEHAERHPFLLSGGQKRRLSVATALVEAAPVLLLDEPTFGQDRGRARALLELLAELHAAGTTILMATHDLQLVAEHASHIAVMAEGRLLRFGTAGEVLASDALAEAGLGEPPLAAAMRRVRSLPGMRRVTRLSDLDDCPPAPRPAGPALEEPADPGSGPEPERAPEAAPEPQPDGARTHDPDAAPEPASETPESASETPESASETPGPASETTAETGSAAAVETGSAAGAGPASRDAAGRRLDRPSVEEARRDRMPWLHRRHPLAKMAVPFATILALFFVRDPLAPALCILLAQLALLTGLRLRAGQRLVLLLVPWLAAGVLSFTLGAWVDAPQLADTEVLFRIGQWPFHLGAWRLGLATGLRLVAIVLLAFLAGAGTAGGDLVRALVGQLRVPYRFGYAALAAFRFVPSFRLEFATIERAHRARGVFFGRGPVGAVRRRLAALVPLMAGAMLHAERLALSMDARGFGHAPTRTERRPLRWTGWDTLLAVLSAATAAAVLLLAPR